MTYNIDKDTKTVTAVMIDCRNDAYNVLARQCANFVPFIGEDLAMPDIMTAKAVCCDCDEFDPKVGIQIARNKLIKKHQKVVRRMLEKHKSMIQNDINQIDLYLSKFEQ